MNQRKKHGLQKQNHKKSDDTDSSKEITQIINFFPDKFSKSSREAEEAHNLNSTLRIKTGNW